MGTTVLADPISELTDRPDGVLAIVTGIEGPSYRPLGARMAVFAEDDRVGTLSSGCIESDIALHAVEALATGRPAQVRYGRGSPFIDIRLPCGGGLDILLVPRPDRAVLAGIRQRLAARQACGFTVDTASGGIEPDDAGPTGWTGGRFHVRIEPELFFYTFGKGPEASTFAGLVQSAGYPNLLLSPDDETLAIAGAAGCATRHLTDAVFPDDLRPDEWSAVVLFFHDHEWEPAILSRAIEFPAFYIGAQGSRRAREARDAELSVMVRDTAALDRIRGPIGLIPSVRDARTLAVSVLAEALAQKPVQGTI